MRNVRYLRELTLITRRHRGILRPEDVVEFASNDNTALHSYFEWDDSVAGYQYRLWQARQLIANVTIHVPDSEEQMRAFVSLKQDRYDGTGYRLLVTVMSDEEMRASLLREALQELETFREKYHELRELAGIFEELDRVRVQSGRQERRAVV